LESMVISARSPIQLWASNMKATLTVTFDSHEVSLVPEFYARFKELGVDVSRGDPDGRRWLSIAGRLDEDGLRQIVDILQRCGGVLNPP
jgi:hypothetical protein